MGMYFNPGNGSFRSDTAIRQIKEKQYAGALKGFSGRIVLAGIKLRQGNKKARVCDRGALNKLSDRE